MAAFTPLSSCPPPSYTTVPECRDGFVNIVTRRIKNGVITEHEVTVTDQPCDGPNVTFDVEYVCGPTETIELHVITLTEGVPSEPDITDTGIICDLDVFDYEQPAECRNGTIHVILNLSLIHI